MSSGRRLSAWREMRAVALVSGAREKAEVSPTVAVSSGVGETKVSRERGVGAWPLLCRVAVRVVVVPGSRLGSGLEKARVMTGVKR